jgi:hypothetical protein
MNIQVVSGVTLSLDGSPEVPEERNSSSRVKQSTKRCFLDLPQQTW